MKTTTFTAAALAVLTLPLTAQRTSADGQNLEKGLAIQGYDPVAYFEVGGGSPTKGSEELSVTFDGATYRFATEKNRDLFLERPTRFEPFYGGWCAYAMAEGDKVEIDPESFLIQDERLLLFYKGFFANTRKSWLKNPDGLKRDADREWVELVGAAPRDTSQLNLAQDGTALSGYDPVSYHAEAGPRKGDPKIATTYRGVRYLFSTPENRLAFLADPEHHEPAYGGWCAYGIAKGQKFEIDPQSFLIQDGRLLVFYNRDGNDTRKPWQEDAPANERRADANWKKLR